MKIDPEQTYAVLTGDIIRSSKLPPGLILPDILTAISTKAEKTFPGSIPLPVDIFRGDSWQLVLTDPKLSLRIAVFIRAMLKIYVPEHKIDTRISIALGKIDSLPGNRVSQGDGAAFRESGRGLEEMPGKRFMGFFTQNKNNTEAFDLIIHLLDSLIIRWTPKQAFALSHTLQGVKQKDIGHLSTPPVRQNVIAEHLEKASWDVIERSLLFFENTILKHKYRLQSR